MTKIRFTRKPTWNQHLRNTYRDWFTESNGHFFRVSADTLYSAIWKIDEINQDGSLYYTLPEGKKEGTAKLEDWDFGISGVAFTLAEARHFIETRTA